MQSSRLTSKQKGFTLIEMLVSIALFSVVLTVTLSTIITIADSNKKARSLMSVMNNLNFAVDSMTRSVKSGTGLNTSGSNCFTTEEINYAAGAFNRRDVTYCVTQSGERGVLTKNTTNNSSGAVPLTSDDVDIDFFNYQINGTESNNQPMITFTIEGTVKVSERIRSKFTIQSSVSQRQLNIQ